MKIVIVGAGEVGYHIASRLAVENKEVVVIDRNPEALRRVSDSLDVQVVEGSGGSPLTLEAAGIREADILLAVTDSDETNLLACLMADVISRSTRKLIRLRDADYDQYHDALRENAPHIDTIINPEIEVVLTIDRLMSMPGAVDVGEFAEGRVKFVGIQMEEETRLAGIRLMDIPDELGDQRILIAAVVRNEKLIIPRGKDKLLPGDLIYFISEEGKLMETLKIFNKHAKPIRHAMIIGGGRVGTRLARRLSEKNIHTKIMERSEDRCNLLAKELDDAVILCGDGSDQRLLEEENIRGMDMVVTLTDDEETNILTSLLVKRLGVPKTITKIRKFSYFPLMLAIGMEQVVNTRLSAINTILQHIRKGKVLSAISIKGEEAEVMEAVALETSDIVGKRLQKLPFPKGALVACIIRGDEIIIPRGDSIIQHEDRVIIFAMRNAIPKVEKILSVKLEYF